MILRSLSPGIVALVAVGLVQCGGTNADTDASSETSTRGDGSTGDASTEGPAETSSGTEAEEETSASTSSLSTSTHSTSTQASSTTETSLGTSEASSEDSSTGPSESSSSGEDIAGTAQWLSGTGLFADIASETLAPGVLPYEPQFELWSDTSGKRRWFYLPPGTQIDTSDMDDWKFPIGTKIWKEFSRDGVRIETRLLEKLPPERAREGWSGWLTVTYVWNDEETDAELTIDGLLDAKGTPHDVPDEQTCNSCHDARPERPIGVSALQLSHERGGMTLTSMAAEGMLSNPPGGLLSDPPTVPFVVPGNDTERAVLGYLHANCGHCHREGAPANQRVSSLLLWMDTDRLESVETTQAYGALVNVLSTSGHGGPGGFEYRVHGQSPDESELVRRIAMRGEYQMPEVGTEMVDEAFVELVRTWIQGLPNP